MRWQGIVAVAGLVLTPLAADAKIRSQKDFTFPAGEPVRIVVFRPDVEVGQFTTGGVEQPDADWTATARDKLGAQLRAHEAAGGNEVVFVPEQDGAAARTVADYQSLFRAVASSVVQYNMTGQKLPTKHDTFDWTLGPGAEELGRIGGGNYALFLYTHDSFGTTGRKAVQILTAILTRQFTPAGIHVSYAGLIDLHTGDLVWFNVDPGSGGDPRTDEGATKRIGQLLNGMPRKAAP